MARGPSLVSAFYSINEAAKPLGERVHHNNSASAPGRDIPAWERRPGTRNYRLCEVCQKMNSEGR
jgi:hypothetical protein